MERTIRRQDQDIRKQFAMLNIFERNINETGRTIDSKGPPTILLTLSHWAHYTTLLDDTTSMFDDSAKEVQETWREARKLVDKNIAENPLGFRIRETSLVDIGQMPLPLNEVDIRRIDHMVQRPAKLKMVPQGQRVDPTSYIQSIVNFAASQAELHRKAPISDEAKPILQRLKYYWEYYSAWAFDSENENSSVHFLYKMAHGNLLTGMIPFLSARFSITPSSTYRIIDNHIDNFGPFLKFFLHHTSYIANLAAYTREYPAPGLPQALEPYQYTDPKQEAGLVKTLQQAYQQREIPAQAEPTNSLLSKISFLYHRNIRDGILRSDNKFLRIPTSEDNFFREILAGVTHGKTITIIALTEDTQTYVTLDLVQGRPLLGIPAQIKMGDPCLANKLIQDILTPLLQEGRRRNPLAEYKPTIKNGAYATHASQQSAVLEQPSKPPKRKVLRVITDITSGRRPTLSVEVLPGEEKDKHMLVYKNQVISPEDLSVISEEIAEDLVPNDTTRLKSDIRLIIESLMEDPYGPGTYKITDARPLKSYRGDVRRLPFGNKEYSDRLRTVYYINPKNRSVNLIHIVTHDEFSKLYGGKHR